VISEVIVTAEKRERRRAAVPAAISAFAGRVRELVDPAARLRAAAAAGRTSEVEALLKRGVAVDSPDAKGDTALMESIQADHPDAAAALVRHGASLDRRNKAGESARDMATSVDDADLDQALGLAP
jgi:ankyrin repeat protein